MSDPQPVEHPDAHQPDGPGGDSQSKRQTAQLTIRLAWFVALWLAGVFTVASIAYAIRLLIR